jgi:glutamate racemase
LSCRPPVEDFPVATDNRCIGVFDSGIGGMTVVRTLRDRLPQEDIVYFGDTARVPYGIKSLQAVTAFARQDSSKSRCAAS